MKNFVKEIEVKAKVRNKKKLIAALEKLGCKFDKPITQHDTVFIKNGAKFENAKQGSLILRIREEKNRTLFTLKQKQEVDLSSLEHELEIGSKEKIRLIIEVLGFSKLVTVNKIRTKTKYKNYEICLDEVEGLGSYIEVEKMSSEESIKTQDELFKFLETLGISAKDRERRGYDKLVYFKKPKTKPKVIIAVGSTNPTKIEPVENIFSHHFNGVGVVGVDVNSGVSDQPKSQEEMFEGALTRAKKAIKRVTGAKYGVGIEGGIHEYSYGHFESSIVVIINKKGEIGIGASGGIVLPPKIIKKIEKGKNLEQAIDELFGTKKIGRGIGMFGIMTKGVVTRSSGVEHGVAFALGRFLHKDIY